jgi:type II secretory pathway component PulF
MAIATTAKKAPAASHKGALSLEALRDLKLENPFGEKISARDQIFFTNQLSLMLEIGTPLNQSLSVIATQIKNKKFKKVIMNLLEEVEDGKMLSQALRKYPQVFSAEYVSLVNAGENSGHLREMLDRAMELQEKREGFITSLKGAMTYPIVLCIVTIGVVIFMLAFVLPRFTELFEGIEEVLPPTTKLLMAMSHVLRGYWYLFPFLIAIIWWGLREFLKTEKGRLSVDKLKVSLPPLSGIYIKIYLSQFMRTLGFLIQSNVPLMEALQITQRGASNLLFSKFIDKLSQNVEAGKGISPAFMEAPFIPETVRQMVRTGEESQKVDRVMLRLSDYYESEIETQIKKFTIIVEPLLLILMGIVVGVIVISLILPIFKLSKVVH